VNIGAIPTSPILQELGLYNDRLGVNLTEGRWHKVDFDDFLDGSEVQTKGKWKGRRDDTIEGDSQED
jgi:hypothetical protein